MRRPSPRSASALAHHRFTAASSSANDTRSPSATTPSLSGQRSAVRRSRSPTACWRARAIASVVWVVNMPRTLRRLSRVKQVKRHAILPEAWLPGGEVMTPTQKVRRSVVDELNAEEIAALYS